jgi:hypothetical protein
MYNRTMLERRTLDGLWSFWADKDRVTDDARGDESWLTKEERQTLMGPHRDISVPGVWQAQFDDLRRFAGVAWYERSAPIPSAWSSRTIRLRFGAVDYLCSVWINGIYAGGHEGGYLPFAVDISDKVKCGAANTVTIRVLDPGPSDKTPVSFAEIPHGKQSWYGPLGGLWQSVFLEARPPTFVDRISIDPDVGTGTVTTRAWLGRPARGGELVDCRVTSPDRHTTWTEVIQEAERGGTEFELRVAIGQPELWDVESPRLYSLDVRCHNTDGSIDELSDTFGWRTVATRDGKVLLNDRPVYLLGALDQDYYHGTIAAPPSDDLLRRQMLLARELGLNLLRCHIKVPDPRYLYWADRLGILVWAELPNWIDLTEDSSERARQTLQGMIERDAHHPSIIIWSIVNESWGADLAGKEHHRRWLRDTFTWGKSLDRTRLFVDNSACPPNFHVVSDINDFHVYRTIPDWCDEWTDWVDSWIENPGITYSPHGDARRSEDEPQVVSEFGNWGLPDVRELIDDDGNEPWWFDTGQEWGDGVMHPRGIERRFAEWGLSDVFGSWDGFVAASQQHQFEGLKFEIEDLRRRNEIAGYVITEFTDVHWECNGLLDLARNSKTYHHHFSEINAPDVVLARPLRYRYVSGETVHVETSVAHWSADISRGWSVRWSVEGFALGGWLDGLSLDEASVGSGGRISFAVPDVECSTRAILHLSLRDHHDREVNRNSVPLLLFTTSDATAGAYSDVVRTRLDDATATELQNGARVVVIATSEDALAPGLAASIKRRSGTPWKGDWAQGMSWLRPPLTEGLPLLSRMDMTFVGLTPRHVILGYGPDDKDDVLSGYYLGWLHATVANIAAFTYGSGAGIVCTLPLLDQTNDDPLAAALLNRLCELVSSPNFSPTKRL